MGVIEIDTDFTLLPERENDVVLAKEARLF
jgi:hypothetical protein